MAAETSKIGSIGIIGAGLMGHGIALTLARAGQYVAITDPFPEARASVAGRIRASAVSTIAVLRTSDAIVLRV